MAKSRRIYYTMGQICEMFDLPASTIRFWEQRFKILSPRKNAKGNRLFTPIDLENLKLIYHLTKEKKMTLSGAESYIMQRKVAAKSEMTIVEILGRMRSTLIEIRQEIESAEQRAKAEKDASESGKSSPKEIIIVTEQVEDNDAMAVNLFNYANTPAKSDDMADDYGSEEDIEMAEEGWPPRAHQLDLF